ncbi:hypothetical protein [Paraburkholderia sp.]|uniref:hypothetical protein n=1 Tax=Paraburkholderia sp. TaxID=1926495 RepID=UPI003D6E7312
MITFIDYEISHIARVMRPSLVGDLAGPILPSNYWRRRLHQLLNRDHLTKGQLCTVDSLLLELDDFDRISALPMDAQGLGTQVHTPRVHHV